MGIVKWSKPSTRRRCRRLSTPPAVLVQSHQQLPRQLAEVSGATTPGSLGSPPLDPKLLREFLLSLVGFWVAAPLCRSVGFWVAAPSFVPPLPGAGVPTDPQSPEGGSQWCRITRGVPTPRLLGVSRRWCCFGSHTLPSRTVALITQSYPADLEATLLQLGLATSTSSSFEAIARVRDDSGRSPRRRRTVAHRAPRVRDDSGRSPRPRRTVWHRARKAACSFNCR